jgi:hypothetical protein
MVQILPLEKRKEDEQRGGEGRRQEKGSDVLFWVAGAGVREYLWYPRRGPKYPQT